MNLSRRAGLINSSAIRKIFDLAASIDRPLNLSIGQPDFPVPDPVKEALKRAIDADKNGYSQTQGILPFREKLAEFWRKDGIHIVPEHILVSTGVASILHLLFEVLFDERDTVILVEPYFLIYKALADFHSVKIVTIPETFGRGELEQVRRQYPEAKAVFYSTPSNPTGRIISREQINALGGWADATGGLLVSDEIYDAYDYDGKFIRTASVYPDRTLTLGGFSKTYSMTGLRLGYIGVPQALSHITDAMARLQQYSVVCCPHPVQWAGITALDTDISANILVMKERRDYVLKQLNGRYEFASPDGAFYFFIRTAIDGEQFAEAAIRERLLTVPGHIFTPDRNYIRISYAQPMDVLQEAIPILTQLLQNNAG